MIQKPNTNYGARTPEAVEKHPDTVVLNTNIAEHEDSDGNIYYTADAQILTYQEYTDVQDDIIAEMQVENLSRDELLAELLEVE